MPFLFAVVAELCVYYSRNETARYTTHTHDGMKSHSLSQEALTTMEYQWKQGLACLKEKERMVVTL